MFIVLRSGPARLVLLGALVLSSVGCDGGREGDRCNPLLSHDDCNDGLLCMQPSTCVESYCCPVVASSSTNPYCNGMACPAATPEASASFDDSGTSTDGGGAEASAASDAAVSPDGSDAAVPTD